MTYLQKKEDRTNQQNNKKISLFVAGIVLKSQKIADRGSLQKRTTDKNNILLEKAKKNPLVIRTKELNMLFNLNYQKSQTKIFTHKKDGSVRNLRESERSRPFLQHKHHNRKGIQGGLLCIS